MICVTGAGGTLGSELVRQLAAAKVPFRVAHFSEKKAQAARAQGIETSVIDYARPATLRAAFQRCDELFLLGPTVEDQTQLEIAGVEAAQAAGVRHVEVPPSDLKGAMVSEGTPERIADWLLDLERYYREGHASRVTDDVERVTGRAPRRFAESARDFAPHLQAQ